MLCYINKLVICLSNTFRIFCNSLQVRSAEDYKISKSNILNTKSNILNTKRPSKSNILNTNPSKSNIYIAMLLLIITFVA